jgi:feruloyl esterase
MLLLLRSRIARLVVLLLVGGCSAVTAQELFARRVLQTSALGSCRSLRGIEIPASSLGLPTSGAHIKSAKLVHDHRGEYCKVLGAIRPVDTSAQAIRFEVNLPASWNHKAVQFGGGTFDGWLGGPASGLKGGPASISSQPEPLARGFATFGGDSGHHKRYFPLPDALNAINASFAKNLEERQNFAHDSLKKTHDVAVFVIERFYGVQPSRMFFLGGSTGGREAYLVIQRWPEDYDGVFGAYAGWDEIELDLQYARVSQALYSPGGFLTRSQTRLLAQSVLNACDALDGVRDGIISNTAACHFDPATLLCPAGMHGKRCITPSQLRTIQAFASEQRTAQPLWNGVQSSPGFNVLSGADLTGYVGLLHHPQRRPKLVFNSFYYLIVDRILRNFLVDDKHFSALAFDPTTGGEHAADLLS